MNKEIDINKCSNGASAMLIDEQLKREARRYVSRRDGSLKRLAESAGVQYWSLHRWLDESKDCDINFRTAAAIAEALGLELRKGGN